MKKKDCKRNEKGIRQDLEEAKRKSKEYLDDLKRVQAEFENFKKRLERDKQEFVGFANSELIKEFLPVLDSIDSALNALKENKESREGVELIKKQLMQVLERHGLKEIPCSKGELFNAEKHECMMQGNEKGLKEGVVLEELQRGYLLNGRVIRPAMVKINKPREEK